MPELEERQAKIEGIPEQIDKRLNHLESDLNGLRDELHIGMDNLRGDMNSGINSLRSEMRAEIGELRSKMDANFRWIIGIMITMWATIILGITSTILTIIFKG